jgi:hypothetical protein
MSYLEVLGVLDSRFVTVLRGVLGEGVLVWAKLTKFSPLLVIFHKLVVKH